MGRRITATILWATGLLFGLVCFALAFQSPAGGRVVRFIYESF